jgi:hypothetical protein
MTLPPKTRFSDCCHSPFISPALQCFQVRRGDSTTKTPLEALAQALASTDAALVVELCNASAAKAEHHRTSLYALMADSTREGECRLRRLVQREDVAFFPEADVGGAVLHPHVDHPIVPGWYDQHLIEDGSDGRRRGEEELSVGKEKLFDCLAVLPGMSSSHEIISDPYWQQAEQIIGGSRYLTPSPISMNATRPNVLIECPVDVLCCVCCAVSVLFLPRSLRPVAGY